MKHRDAAYRWGDRQMESLTKYITAGFQAIWFTQLEESFYCHDRWIYNTLSLQHDSQLSYFHSLNPILFFTFIQQCSWSLRWILFIPSHFFAKIFHGNATWATEFDCFDINLQWLMINPMNGLHITAVKKGLFKKSIFQWTELFCQTVTLNRP